MFVIGIYDFLIKDLRVLRHVNRETQVKGSESGTDETQLAGRMNWLKRPKYNFVEANVNEEN